MKILVIGSKGHSRAHCVDWRAPLPNIEEYDSVVINLQSLSQELFDKIYPLISGELAKEVKTLFDTDREVFCIINEYIIPTPPTTGFRAYVRPPPTNYDWLPAIVSVAIEKPGTSMNIIDKRFEKYLETVEQWIFVLDLYKEPPYKEALERTTAQFLAEAIGETAKVLRYQLLPIAENKSKKIIAGTLAYQGRKGRGGIHLIPPPTKSDVQKAIETVLDIICGQPAKTYPLWRDEIEVPGTKELVKLINNELQEINGIQEKISSLQNRVQQLDVYRDLVSSTGEDLVKAVQITLSDLGVSTRTTEKGFPTDLVNDKVAVEVTGIKGAVSVSSEKVNQTARFKESFRKKEKIILIANTHVDSKPSEREGMMDFTPEVKRYFEAIDVCCMTSKTLFELWKDVKNKKRNADDIIRTMLFSKGELAPRDFGKSHEKP